MSVNTEVSNKQLRTFLMLSFLVIAAVVTLLYLPKIDLPNRSQDFLTLSLSVVYEAFPFLVLGSVLSVLVGRYVGPKRLHRYLPKNPVLRRLSIGLFGVFLPVCECGNVPLARGLMQNGLKPGEVMTFLLAAPILNPITIITTTQAFGNEPRIVFWRIAGAFFVSQVVGWVFSNYSLKQATTHEFTKTCEVELTPGHKHSLRQDIATEVQKLVPALIFGACIAGLSQTLIPRSILTAAGNHPVISILAMLALAFVISICANVDAFFALAFSNTFSTGAIVSFLVFGPMIDIKILTLLRTTFKPRVLAQMSVLVFLMSFAIGLVVNYA